MSFGVIIFIIGNIIQITAMNSWVHMMIGRFVAGLGVGNLSVGVPMFQSECAPREIRGAVVASYQLMITFGILISNIVCYGVRNIQDSDASWRIVIGLGIAFSLPLGIGIMFVPESPRWLAGRHRWEDARMSMARLRGMKDDPKNELVEEDIQEMYALVEKEERAGVGGWLECFSDRKAGIPKTLYRTLLGILIHFLQQWTGVNYFCEFSASSARVPRSHQSTTARPSSTRLVSRTLSKPSSSLVLSTSPSLSTACTSSRSSAVDGLSSSARSGRPLGCASSRLSACPWTPRTTRPLAWS